ncbi:hypothetical protein C1H46_044171 [Malus baccata]|uniref:Uncharacterized protein n=1 Tax=Malus baccata TaxID=106549 RepID=A0A540K7U4_MALBA|nr:hypothetical protein C1H46_044171 [Malus baccata]
MLWVLWYKSVSTAGQLQRSLSTSICFLMLRFCETDIPENEGDIINEVTNLGVFSETKLDCLTL